MNQDEATNIKVNFKKLQSVAKIDADVIPCCVQDSQSLEVLNIAYVNQEAIQHTIKTGNATFWSTSRNELWEKGLTSGDFLKIIDIRINCGCNSIVYLVEPVKENQCHTQRKSCYYRSISSESLNIISWVDGYSPKQS
jgi:phosphoribosyl-AMP cyclohydrolase